MSHSMRFARIYPTTTSRTSSVSDASRSGSLAMPVGQVRTSVLARSLTVNGRAWHREGSEMRERQGVSNDSIASASPHPPGVRPRPWVRVWPPGRSRHRCRSKAADTRSSVRVNAGARLPRPDAQRTRGPSKSTEKVGFRPAGLRIFWACLRLLRVSWGSWTRRG